MKKAISLYQKLLSITILIVITLFLFTGCGKSSSYMPPTNNGPSGTSGGSNTAAQNAVTIQNGAFSPNTITIVANSSVTWSNKNGDTQTVTSDTGLFDSGNILNNYSYTYLFPVAGTFNYHSTANPMITGIVVVTASASTSTGY